MLNWPFLFLSTLVVMAPGARDCSTLQTAHEALLKSSFTCERHFTVKLNGELKVTEIARITYSNGALTKQTLEKEVLDKNVVLEEGEEEASLALPFDCGRIEQINEDAFELSNSDETKKVVFIWDPESNTLRPGTWKNNETKRFLWKKLRIEAKAEYKNFAWQ